MQFIVFTALFLSVSFASEIGPHLDRKEGISYSTKTIHHDPKHPEHQAQSSVDFTLGTGEEVAQEIKKLQPKGKENYPQYSQHQSKTPTQQTRSLLPTYKQLQSYAQQSPSNIAPSREPSQSFNVGYSVKFENGVEQRKVTKRPKIESDVITGSRKEEVRKPGGVRGSTRFTEGKKPSASKMRYTKVVTPASFLETGKYEPEIHENLKSEPSPWQSLSPSVEIYRSKDVNSDDFDHAKALGKSEGFDYSNAIDFSGQRTVEGYKVPETYKSHENYKIPENYKVPESYKVPEQENVSFNFEALNNYGKSLQDFNENKGVQDYSSQNNFPEHLNYESVSNVRNHERGRDYSAINNFKDVKEDFSFAPQNQGHVPSQTLALFTPNNYQDYYNDKTQIIPKLPIDTSLLRDPILTLNNQARPDHRAIPIHYDTQLMKEYSQVQEPQPTTLALTGPQTFEESQEEIPNQQNNNNQELIYKQQPINNAQAYQQFIPQYPQRFPVIHNHQQIPSINNVHQFNNLISEHSNSAPHYQQSEISDLKLGFPQNALFNPGLTKLQEAKYYKNLKQKPKMYMVSENMQDNSQPKQTQFKVFGKPHHPMMRHEFQKHLPRYEGPLRQPRLNQKRIIRDYSFEKEMMPPSVGHNGHSNNYSRARRYHLKY